MHSNSINTILVQQRNFFATHTTKTVAYRIDLLKKLKKMIIDHKESIMQALFMDLKKSSFQAYTSELSPCLEEINMAIRCLAQWAKNRSVKTPLSFFPLKSSILPEPRGIVLIISPWNFPFQLLIMPLIGALAAGNCALLKPSEFAPHTADVIKNLIEKTFDQAIIAVVKGGIPETQELLQEQFDYIFFTGSPSVGKIVMHAAAEHLTPLTLELGGQNPCIVDATATLTTAAKRITWAKFYNAGQNCLAPNYLFVHKKIKDSLIDAMKCSISSWYPHGYTRIISQHHFDRLSSLLRQDGNVVVGGKTDSIQLYIEPTLIDTIQKHSTLLKEEIFGPILPIITFEDIQEVIDYINAQPKPLALYVFSNDRALHKKVINETSSGSVGINDMLLQAMNLHLPFGGVGRSGFGAYHGKASFDTFSHYKSIIKNSSWLDNPVRYPPHKRLQAWYKNFLSFFNT